jgi:hypothetical protein
MMTVDTALLVFSYAILLLMVMAAAWVVLFIAFGVRERLNNKDDE